MPLFAAANTCLNGLKMFDKVPVIKGGNGKIHVPTLSPGEGGGRWPHPKSGTTGAA